MSKLGSLLKDVLEWDGKDNKFLNDKIAESHYLLAHMMPTHRGSASIAKIYCQALYYYHGFELVCSNTEIDMQALKQPHVKEFIEKYSNFFVKSPNNSIDQDLFTYQKSILEAKNSDKMR